MAIKPNHRCKVCGVAYYHCDGCDITNHWKSVACKLPHYHIFLTVSKYNRNAITKEEAMALIQATRVTQEEINSFPEHIRDLINVILKEEQPVVELEQGEEARTEVVRKKSKNKN